MTTLLELNHIETTVNTGTPNERAILKDLNLTVGQGEFITLLGTNGAGKSTLLSVINGSLRPSHGQVVINQHPVTKLPEAKRAKYIAQVFQDPKLGTAPRMTVAENLLLAAKRGQRRSLIPRRLNAHLDEFKQLTSQLPNGLSDRLTTAAGDLSGGQRQTLSFLMATMTKPQLLLLDEHTAALDPNTSHQLMALTDQVVTQQELTCIMITHQIKDALKYGNRIIILNQGQIVLDVKGPERSDLSEADLLQYFEA